MLDTLLFLLIALSALWIPGLLIFVWLVVQYAFTCRRRRAPSITRDDDERITFRSILRIR